MTKSFNAVLFSLNAAFTAVSSLSVLAQQWYSEHTLAISRDILRTNINPSTTEFGVIWIPTLLLALTLFALQAARWRTSTLWFVLHSVAGFMALSGPVALWLCVNGRGGWQFGVEFWGAVVEFPLALFLVSRFRHREMRSGSSPDVLFLAIHFLLWFWLLRGVFTPINLASSVVVLGFLAAIAWRNFVKADEIQFMRGTDLPISL